jgi:CheY-like chemotaxis protein
MAETISMATLRILVVEDEALVALMIEDMLDELGCVVAGSARSVRDALTLVGAGEMDGAILDLNLGGEPVYPVAEALAAVGIPFVFLTGYGVGGIDARFAGVPTIAKPFHPSALEQAVDHFRR